MNNPIGVFLVFLLSNFCGLTFAQQDFFTTSEGVSNCWYNPATITTFNCYSLNATSTLSPIDGIENPYVVQVGAATKLTNLMEKHPCNEFGLGIHFSQDDLGSMQTNLISATLNYQLVLNKSRLFLVLRREFVK